MPRFFVHQRTGKAITAVFEGIEYKDLQEAIQDSEFAIREIIADRLRSNQPLADFVFEIADEQGGILETISLYDPRASSCSRVPSKRQGSQACASTA